MTEILKIKPGPSPAKITAFHRAKTLKEHMEAFLSINGARSEKSKDKIKTADGLYELFQNFLMNEYVTLGQYREVLDEMVSGYGTVYEISKRRFTYILVRSLGYFSFIDMLSENSIRTQEDSAVLVNKNHAEPTKFLETYFKLSVGKEGIIGLLERIQLEKSTQEPGYEELVEFLLECSSSEKFSIAEIKEKAKRLRKIHGVCLRHIEALDAIATCLGLNSYREIIDAYGGKKLEDDFIITNRRLLQN